METMRIADVQQAIAGVNPEAQLKIDYEGYRIFEPVQGPVKCFYTPWGKKQRRTAVLEVGQVAYYLEKGICVPLLLGDIIGLYRCAHLILFVAVSEGYTRTDTLVEISQEEAER